MSHARPPAWAERILRSALPPSECDYVIGDLREEFAGRAARHGRARALLWYLTETARSLWPLLTYSGNWRRNAMMGIEQDLRGAFRVFFKSPGFAAVVVVTIALGVGSAAAVFSVVRGVLLSPMPFPDSERVVAMWGRTPDYPRIPLTVGDFNDIAAGVRSLDGVSAEWGNTALILGEAEAEQVRVGWVTDNFFDVIGVRPALGRVPDAPDAIMISHELWERRYGADPDVVGSVVNLSGESFELVGVLPADQDPNLTSFAGGPTRHQVWRLMPPEWVQGDDRSVGWLRSNGRLRDDVTLAEAQAEIDAFMQQLNQTVTDRDGGTDLSIPLVTARGDLVRDVSRTLWVLLAAVCGVLLIAATNVAHLMLGRGELRTGEVAVRAALGGSRSRLVRQLLIESGVLAITGAAAGLFIAWWGIQALVALAPPTLPRLEQVQLDGGVLAFALLATALTTVVFGVIPALRVTRVDSAASLRDRRAGTDRRQQRLSRGLVVAQVALSLALVSATGLLIKSMSELRAVDLGFHTEGVVTFALEAPDWGDDNASAAARMVNYLDRVNGIPGVVSSGFSNRVPLGGGLFTGTFRTEAMVATEAPKYEAAVRYITPGYFDAMGARLSAGRDFRVTDHNQVVIIDETAAARAWPGENPIGRRLEIGLIGSDPILADVIGVVAPMRHDGVADAPTDTVFSPVLANAQQNFRYMAVRVDGDPLSYLDPLRAAVREVDAQAVIARIRTMEELFEDDVAATAFATLLLSLFGGTALVLATVGLHGVMAVSLRGRRREMGIRMALGAEPRAILTAAAGSGALIVGVGVIVGTLLSLAVGRALGALLYEVQPTDVSILTIAAAVIFGVGLLGAYLPARLVLAVDPADTLREE